MIRITRILSIELTVAELTRAERFYVEALGFTAVARGDVDPALLGADRVQQIALRRGGQTLVLQAFQPAGAAYPAGASACDQVFQHFALPVPDMRIAMARLLPHAPAAISLAGPQHLPARSGGAVAYKFRDPDGHPLELIQFPSGGGDGIDHSAIAVADAERSIAFYRDELGLRSGARQLNTGPEQDALDGLRHTAVEVVALLPEQAAPHLELLAYRTPLGRPMESLRPRDIAATRLVLEATGLPEDQPTVLAHDPDGHAMLLVRHANQIDVIDP